MVSSPCIPQDKCGRIRPIVPFLPYRNGVVMQGQGPCQYDPDLWFPEMPHGRPHPPTIGRIAEGVRVALEICETCPFKYPCGEEGMRAENLPYGIWGGKMAGERLIEKGHQMSDFSESSEERRAIVFTIRMTPLVRWQDAHL